MHPLAPILCASLPGIVCAFAHYFPWRHWFKRGRLPRLWAYVVGLLSILVPATLAALFAASSAGETIGLLWLAAGSAGIGTLIPWWHDWTKRAEYNAADAAERELYGE